MLTIVRVNNDPGAITIVQELFEEYSKGLNEDLCFQSFEEELQDPLKKYGEPAGCLYLACWHKKPAGCIAFQPLPLPGVCEMKRLYVKPLFRNKGIAEHLVSVLLKEAKMKGYNKMVLDTLERLQPAIRLYRRHGFNNTSAYYANPLQGVVYMEKVLLDAEDTLVM